ncbi:uncharacterized protein LOC100679000 [Nasonia vitripennis]|uniref:Uncharacterized protein n=1 Tax=Nasonia vitripennis TaxID=7425 RepID=A0A7M7H749_NASVI|nr:uncharacterized protein LOC100679000 [Nasonia vitripennis]XP_008210099.1 uncharacterized protein LOC100679000 [Nasonia vitripennis]
MRDTKNESPRDGTLRIHRRRAGTYQPKDSLGLSCILQANDASDEGDKLLTRRRALTAPQDNIGISCLPSKDSSQLPNKSDSELEISELASIKDMVLGPEKKTIFEDLWRGNDAAKQKKEMSNPTSIGISNIRRPRNESTNTRKPILPKDNIGHCCRLLQKPTASTTSIKSLGKDSKVRAKPIKSGTSLKVQQDKKNSKGSRNCSTGS